MNQELITSIKERLALGRTKEDIKNEFLDAGWTDSNFEAAYQAVIDDNVTPLNTKIKWWKTRWLVLGLTLPLLLSGLLLVLISIAIVSPDTVSLQDVADMENLLKLILLSISVMFMTMWLTDKLQNRYKSNLALGCIAATISYILYLLVMTVAQGVVDFVLLAYGLLFPIYAFITGFLLRTDNQTHLDPDENHPTDRSNQSKWSRFARPFTFLLLLGSLALNVIMGGAIFMTGFYGSEIPGFLLALAIANALVLFVCFRIYQHGHFSKRLMQLITGYLLIVIVASIWTAFEIGF